MLTKQESLVEVGTSGLRRFGGFVHEEFLPELRGIRGVKVYDEMRRNDPVIGAVLRATRDTIRSVTWGVTPGGKEEADEKARAFLMECMDDMSHTFNDFIGEVCSMLAFGWAWFEVTYKIRNGPEADPPSRYDDGLIGWRKIALRGQETLQEWVFDEHGGIQALRQLAPPTYRPVDIPINKSILFRIDKEKNNPEGTSLLRVAYRPWYMKKNLEEIEGIGIERDFTGVPIVWLPLNATSDDRTTARDILEKLKADEQTGLILQKGIDDPHSWGFELVNSPGSKSIDVDKAINRYSGEIAMSFLAQFLRLGQQRVGSYALSRDHRDFFYMAVASILDIMQETINRYLVPPLFSLNNFDVQSLPQIEHGRVGQREISDFVNVIKTLAEIGLLGEVDTSLIQFLRGEVGLPDLPEEEQKEAVEFSDEYILDRLLELNEDEYLFADPKGKTLPKIVAKLVQSLTGVTSAFKVVGAGTWRHNFRQNLKNAFLDAYLVGAKAKNAKVKALAPEHKAELQAIMKEQDRYIKQFQNDIQVSLRQTGALPGDWQHRVSLYGKMAEGMFERGYLSQDPGGEYVWSLGAVQTEHCVDCIARSEMGAMTAARWRDLGPPRTGNTRCLSNCKCELVPKKD